MAIPIRPSGWSVRLPGAKSHPMQPSVVAPKPARAHQGVVAAELSRQVGSFAVGRLATVRRFLARTSARLVVMMGWLPVWLAVATVAVMFVFLEPIAGLSPPPPMDVAPLLRVAPQLTVVAGIAAGLAGWLTWGAVTNADAMPERSNRRSYDALIGRIEEAEDDIESLVADGTISAQAAPVIELARLQARLHPDAPDGDWASGIGHVNAWRDLHRVEQDLLQVGGASMRLAALDRDELRAAGSVLDAKGSPIRGLLDEGRKGSSRAILSAHAAIDEFRDRNLETLVRARMRTDMISFLLGLVAWALLVLAILSGASTTAVMGASALYLIGVASGLFTQLRGGEGETTEEIFGYGQAQLRQIVLLSGLAAVAGVFLTSATGDATNGGNVNLAPALEFSAITAVTAAAFGLAPGMLTDRLSDWAKTSIRDLQTTTTAGVKGS